MIKLPLVSEDVLAGRGRLATDLAVDLGALARGTATVARPMKAPPTRPPTVMRAAIITASPWSSVSFRFLVSAVEAGVTDRVSQAGWLGVRELPKCV